MSQSTHVIAYRTTDPTTPENLRAYAVLMYAGAPLWSTHGATEAIARDRLLAWWETEKVAKARSENRSEPKVKKSPPVDDLV